MTYKRLVQLARQARRKAHAPYSNFHVGAALLTSSGKVVTGCYIEVSSYSLTICAERTALFKAISDGHHRFKAIAVATDEDSFTPPCGACRQVLMDLAGDIDFVMSDRSGGVRIMKLGTLLPLPFGAANVRSRGKRRR
jgi:cytidine deaminase